MKTEHYSTTQKHTKTPHTFLTKDKSPVSKNEHHVKTEKWRWNWWIS